MCKEKSVVEVFISINWFYQKIFRKSSGYKKKKVLVFDLIYWQKTDEEKDIKWRLKPLTTNRKNILHLLATLVEKTSNRTNEWDEKKNSN